MEIGQCFAAMHHSRHGIKIRRYFWLLKLEEEEESTGDL